MKDIVGGPYHPPLWRCHSTGKQAVMTSQFMARVLCMHGQRAVEQRPRIAATRGVCDRLTLAHQDRPKPHATRARLPKGVGLLWASQRGKSYDKSYHGHRRWALASTIAALLQHGSKARSTDRSVNGNSIVHAWPESSGTAAEDCR